MFCLVYSSIAQPTVDNGVIRDILDTSRKFNSKKKITGCLLFYRGEFIQYLEGKQLAVLELFDRIKDDPRHKKVKLLSHGEIEEREFSGWNMAYEDFMGENDHLQFLKLLVDSYVEDPKKSMDPNPTSKYFWRTARRLLISQSSTKRYK